MSSPAASHDGDASKKDLEQITFKFCSECSNMLYPQEDDGKTELLFMCRTCSYSEPASQYCIFRNVLNNQAGEVAGVTQDVGSDLTVSAAVSSVSHGAASACHAPSEGYAYCICCGKFIMCGVCRQRYAVVPIDQGLPNTNADGLYDDDVNNNDDDDDDDMTDNISGLDLHCLRIISNGNTPDQSASCTPRREDFIQCSDDYDDEDEDDNEEHNQNLQYHHQFMSQQETRHSGQVMCA